MAYRNPGGGRLQQGDVLADVRTFSLVRFDEGDTAVGKLRMFTRSIIVTQDCDLEQDHAARFSAGEQERSPDKLLFGVTLCGAYDEVILKSGQHRPKAKKFGAKEWKPVIKNQDPRYQYLGYVPGAERTLVVDFKDYFMVPCDFLYGELAGGRVQCLSHMDSPYKEHLLQRFAWYLMRVGLPMDFEDFAAPMPPPE